MPLNSPEKPSIIVVWLQELMWNIFISYIHIQNGLVKSLIKRLIDRPLSKNCKSPTSCWHHAVIQTVNLIQINLIAIISALLVAVITWNLASAKYFPSACRLCFTNTDITTAAYIHGRWGSLQDIYPSFIKYLGSL